MGRKSPQPSPNEKQQYGVTGKPTKKVILKPAPPPPPPPAPAGKK